jgi:hypothetical protein
MRTYIQPGDSLGVAVPYAGGVTSGPPTTDALIEANLDRLLARV